MNLKIKEILPYIVIFLMFLYITKCSSKGKDTLKETVRVETVVIESPPDTIPIYVPIKEPSKISKADLKALVDGTYVNTEKVKELESHIDFLEKNLDSIKSVSLNVYNDTIEDTNIIIFKSDLVNGDRLNSTLKYRLKVPQKIITTKTITKKQIQSGLFLNARIGGSKDKFNFGPGLQYITKKGRIIGYDYNIIDNTHNGTIGIKLF